MRRDSIGSGPYVDTSEVLANALRRIGQGKVRDSALRRYQSKCAMCTVDEPRLLIAGHIKPWSRGDKKDRGIGSNVMLLCPLHDSLFGNGFIAIRESKFRVVYSERLSNVLTKFVRRMTRKRPFRPREDPPAKKYLRWHFNNIFS